MRRVSRAWYDVLTSPTVRDAVLRSWSIGSDNSLCIPDGLSEEAIASLRAEHVDAFRTGHPFSLSIHYLKSQDVVAFAVDMFAWIDEKDTSVCWSMNLRTGLRTSFSTEQRYAFSDVAISSSMIVATCYLGKCFVWQHRVDKCHSFTIPSALVNRLLVSGDTLAIVFSPDSLENGIWVQTITWNLQTKRTRSFSLKLRALTPDQIHQTTAVLDKDGESIVYFQLILIKDDDLACHHHHSIRTNLNGEVIAQDSLSAEGAHFTWPNRNEPVQAKRYATIWSMTKHAIHQPTANCLEPCELICIYYDFKKDCLGRRTCVTDIPHADLQSSLFYWEDVAYMSAVSRPNDILSVVDLQRESCSTAMLAKLYPHWSRVGDNEDHDAAFYNRIASQILGDVIFQVHNFDEGILVLCFDKTIDMPNQIKEYRDIRKKHLEESIRSKEPDDLGLEILDDVDCLPKGKLCNTADYLARTYYHS